MPLKKIENDPNDFKEKVLPSIPAFPSQFCFVHKRYHFSFNELLLYLCHFLMNLQLWSGSFLRARGRETPTKKRLCNPLFLFPLFFFQTIPNYHQNGSLIIEK